LTDHPSADELLALVRGRLAPQRSGEILRHLHGGCEVCLAVAPAGLAAGLGVQREPTAKEEAATEAAIDRAFAVALREDRNLRRRQDQRERAVKILVEGGTKGPEQLPKSMKQVDKVEALLAASWSIRFEDIGMMVYFARLALNCAERLDARKYGGKEVLDLQCRALAELGNAYRASDQFDKAGVALARSRQLFELGTRSDLLEIRLLEVEASFDAYSRRFGDACLRLKKIIRYYRRTGLNHLIGRTLLQLGRYTGFANDPEKALRLIDESLDLLDRERDAELVHIASENRIEFLVWCRRYRAAELQLFQLRAMLPSPTGRITELRLRWLTGKIDAGQDRFPRAESIFREVHEKWIELGSGYNTGLISLDLAAVLLAQGKAKEATEIVTSAYKIFAALKIQQEGVMTVLMLRMACEMRTATRDLAEKVTRYLMRIEHDPHAELED
jgi:tetratricopeptide (TPR) repeat protein